VKKREKIKINSVVSYEGKDGVLAKTVEAPIGHLGQRMNYSVNDNVEW